MKTHFHDLEVEIIIPDYIRLKEYVGHYGTLCGYMRKNVTEDPDKVDCFFCKAIMKRTTI